MGMMTATADPTTTPTTASPSTAYKAFLTVKRHDDDRVNDWCGCRLLLDVDIDGTAMLFLDNDTSNLADWSFSGEAGITLTAEIALPIAAILEAGLTRSNRR